MANTISGKFTSNLRASELMVNEELELCINGDLTE